MSSLESVEQMVAYPELCPLPATTSQTYRCVMKLARATNKNNIKAIATYIRRLPPEYQLIYKTTVLELRVA